MLATITAWLAALWKNTFGALWDLITDAFVWVLGGVLKSISTAIAAIGVPDFLADGIGALVSSLPGSVLWILGQLGLAQCFAILAAGYVFRLARKLVTLGQW